MLIARTLGLYLVTAVAEILGCYLAYLWRREGRSVWLLVPGGASLAAFAFLLTFHPAAAGRTYAAYGGIYVSVAILWLWVVERQTPTRWDMVGVAICIVGMMVIVAGPRAGG